MAGSPIGVSFQVGSTAGKRGRPSSPEACFGARGARVGTPLVCNRAGLLNDHLSSWFRLALTLFRLVYVSAARPGLSEQDLEAILNTSQSNNDERRITGYLVHNGPAFMQLLEGPPDEVGEIYRRIAADARHAGVVRILAEPAGQRVFPHWSMNYFRVDSGTPRGRMLVRRDDPVDSLMAADAPRDLLHLFSNFIRQADLPGDCPGCQPPRAGSGQGQRPTPQG